MRLPSNKRIFVLCAILLVASVTVASLGFWIQRERSAIDRKLAEALNFIPPEQHVSLVIDIRSGSDSRGLVTRAVEQLNKLQGVSYDVPNTRAIVNGDRAIVHIVRLIEREGQDIELLDSTGTILQEFHPAISFKIWFRNELGDVICREAAAPDPPGAVRVESVGSVRESCKR